jgi:hypothetical protein
LLPDLQELLEVEVHNKHCKLKLEKCRELRGDDVLDYIFYLHAGKAVLQSHSHPQQWASSPSLHGRTIEIKEGTFFILANLRRINEP